MTPVIDIAPSLILTSVLSGLAKATTSPAEQRPSR
jgi:hypothetical protein